MRRYYRVFGLTCAWPPGESDHPRLWDGAVGLKDGDHDVDGSSLEGELLRFAVGNLTWHCFEEVSGDGWVDWNCGIDAGMLGNCQARSLSEC